jgi:class 3 adenylate cyclase/TolB-like protein
MARGRTTERRRLAAILVADVVGYSRMVAEHENHALADVRDLRRQVLEPAIAAHGGRLFKTMGDGFFAEFPSAVEAVGCGVDVQRRLLASAGTARRPGVALRIGVALGDVVVEGDGDLLGDGVNVAARLHALAEPGGVWASGEVHRHLGGRLALPFEDRGEQAVKNIPYPLRVFALPAGAVAALPAPEPVPAPEPPPRPRRIALAAGAGLAAMVLAVGAGWWALAPRPRSDPPIEVTATAATVARPADAAPPAAPEAPTASRSIVVLPFANLGGGPDQDYLADGITEDLTATLGRLPLMLVIGHGTAVRYKGRAADVRQVGRELGVHYVVEGSVRRLGEQLRVNARLSEAGSGGQLWAESLDEPLADLAGLTRLVTLRIARALDDRLYAAAAERVRMERLKDPNVVELVLRARALLSLPRSRESVAEGRRLYERSLALDEGSADAQAGLALTLVDALSFDLSQNRDGDLELAEAHASRALALKSNNFTAHFAAGMALSFRHRFAQAEAEFDLIIADNPSNVAAIAFRGLIKLRTDRPAEALEDLRDAVRISPRDWNLDLFYDRLATSLLMLGRDEEALGYRLRARAANPQQANHLFLLAAALKLVGRTEEARPALEEFRRLRPNDTIAGWRRVGPRQSPYPLYLATRERQFAAIRAIGGMPEE